MGVDFAAEGLLERLDGEERAARLELLERLEAEGATVDELRAAVADGLLVFLLAERLVDGPPRHRSRDVARDAGVPLELLAAMRRAHGLPVPDPEAVALTAREGPLAASTPRPSRCARSARRSRRRRARRRRARSAPLRGTGRRSART